MLSNTPQMTIFLSGRQRWCTVHATQPTSAALSINTAFE